MGQDGRSMFGIFGEPRSASLSKAWKTNTRMFQACISPVQKEKGLQPVQELKESGLRLRILKSLHDLCFSASL